MSYGFNAGEVFKIAVQIEENGKKFYDDSVKVIDNADVKKLFTDLGIEEVGHKQKFESILAGLPAQATTSTVWDPDKEIDKYIKMMADQHVFVGGISVEEQIAGIKDVKSALKLAIEFEKDSVIFFLTLEEAAESEQGQKLIRSLVKEEQDHLKRLSIMLNKLGH